jgi:radical SAM protein with 4Fe4S-binding SPASM domain
MKKEFAASIPLAKHGLWSPTGKRRVPFSFDIELTARCNNACGHCYINLPAGDLEAQKKELSLEQIGDIADQAMGLGSLWCLLTGGEPLLRADFEEIYRLLRTKGLLVSVYTNACLLNDAHIALFKKHPPRHIEVTVYGVTAETYERVSRCPGSYAAFRRGLDLLLRSGIPVRLKAMALRSNVGELPAIAAFCRRHTKDYFRFDPLLNLRYDGDEARNAIIRSERLPAHEISALEQADGERSAAMKKQYDELIFPAADPSDCRHLFRCGIGADSFVVSWEGRFLACSGLRHPECVADLKTTSLAEAWNSLVPKLQKLTSSSAEYLEKCHACPIVNLCLWCPASAFLETGRLDGWSDSFCRVARARADALRDAMPKNEGCGKPE